MEKELFGAALGVSEPVYINEIVIDMTAGELYIHMDFRRGGRFGCSECGATELGVHDTVEKTWRHLNFFQYKHSHTNTAYKMPKMWRAAMDSTVGAQAKRVYIAL